MLLFVPNLRAHIVDVLDERDVRLDEVVRAIWVCALEVGQDAGCGGLGAADEVGGWVGAVAGEGEDSVEAYAGGCADEDAG